MKKYLITILIFVCAAFCTLGITACVPGDLAAHNWSTEWSSTSTKHWRRCLDPGCNGRIDYQDHEWELTAVYEEPTCGDTGLGQYTCPVCQATMGNLNSPATIPATGEHSWELQSVDAEPTCGQEGTGSYICSECLAYAVFPVPATGKHDYSGNYVITEEGHYHRCLNDCGIDEEIQSHIEGEPQRFEPAGILDGRIEYRCTECDYLMKEEVIPNPKALYRMEVAFVKSSGTVVPTLNENGELVAVLDIDTIPANGYQIKITGYTINNETTSVTNVSYYYYEEFTGNRKVLNYQSGGDESTGYLGYASKFYVSNAVSNVCLLIESAPSGREPVTLIVHIYTRGRALTSAGVSFSILDTVPIYYLKKKINF